MICPLPAIKELLLNRELHYLHSLTSIAFMFAL